MGEAESHKDILVNGIRIHLVESGSGAPVVLLHGFPEFWYSWRHQIRALSQAGYRAVAPDMRGYNTSEKVPGVGGYHIDKLVDDIAGVIDYCGTEKVHLVAHDWGGIVAWYVAMLKPQLIDRLVIMNAPHPGAYLRDRYTTRQWLQSWYAAVFQLPLLPEFVLRSRNFASLERAFRGDCHDPSAFSDEGIALYKQASAQPGALTAGINYYRALTRAAVRATLRDIRPIESPTLLIWGRHDRYLNISLTSGLDRWVPNIRVEILDACSHWVQVDRAQHVNELLLDFLGDATTTG